MYRNITVDNTAAYIESTSPVIVTQYIKAKGSDDSFMMLVPGLSQYKYDYDFAVFGYGFTSYVSVIVPSVHSNDLVLDGSSLSISSGSRNSIIVNNTKYDVFAVPVSAGAHNMKHLNKIRFGLFVYGTKITPNNGYGYPAGLRLT